MYEPTMVMNLLFYLLNTTMGITKIEQGRVLISKYEPANTANSNLDSEILNIMQSDMPK